LSKPENFKLDFCARITKITGRNTFLKRKGTSEYISKNDMNDIKKIETLNKDKYIKGAYPKSNIMLKL
jgi:hypothetical protein